MLRAAEVAAFHVIDRCNPEFSGDLAIPSCPEPVFFRAIKVAFAFEARRCE